jgi:hypothetical protein
MTVLCCDPLAIALPAGASGRRAYEPSQSGQWFASGWQPIGGGQTEIAGRERNTGRRLRPTGGPHRTRTLIERQKGEGD